jgi:prolyl 4-hydroxylase
MSGVRLDMYGPLQPRNKSVTSICDHPRMRVAVCIKPQLRSWIEHNLDRGCPPDQLIEGMIAQQFDPPIAQGLVRAFLDARATGVPLTADTVRIDLPEATHVVDPPRMTAGNSIRVADRVVTVVARVSRPLIAVLANVLSAEECEQLIALARPRLTLSTVVDLPIDHGEGLQVLRYGPGTRYTPHFDFLVPRNEASEQSLRRSGQRVSSMVAYLNDVPGGGETTFPHAGLSVCPQRGNAVYFEYCNSRGQVDAESLHAGAPVTAGEKWAVTKWMRQRRFVSA